MNDVTLTRPAPLRPTWWPVAPPGPTEGEEQDLYPVHEEDNVPEKSPHELQTRYLRDALGSYLGQWVTGNLCMYWEEGNYQDYAAPDVLVVDCEPPDPLPGWYQRWADAPPLLVVEIGSKSTFVQDEGPKLETYELDLEVPEYLYYYPDRRDLRFHRLGEGGYEVVQPDARGWVHSETLNVWFGVDETDWLCVYTPAGERLLSHEEEVRARRAEERARQEAEERARQAEERARQVEERAAAEAQARAAAEAEAERLRAELARFRGTG